MTILLGEIPDRAVVALDANIVIYAMVPQASHHDACARLLVRGARGDLALQLPVQAAADVLHRAMVLEVIAQGAVATSAEAVTYLKRRPAAVQQLTRYRTILHDLAQARVDILPLGHRDLHASRRYRETYGLMTNDSLLVAAMRRVRVHYLATNDADFERIPGITVCLPG